ncbi:hypothetical protein AKO1_003698 [Acrasis kona]|uniref:5-hmdU DNA kinase helical domain-containing protein n=1 Tax=Acrasis kona TaxID=1008807 RepID=A0AAW2Z4P9_9EUKA
MTGKKATMKDMYQALLQVKGIGRFLAFQITADLIMIDAIEFDKDFVMLGPGARKGLLIINGNTTSCADLLQSVNNELKSRYEERDQSDILNSIPVQELRLIDIEHGLCEYIRYYKAVRGCYPKKYVPSTKSGGELRRNC